MYTSSGTRGPDLALVGAARSATSYLAARLGEHRYLDPGAVKESNFYSVRYAEGYAWYDGLYSSSADLLRLDASVSYTYPQHSDALPRLAADAPDSIVAYVVRDPISRAVSHYHYNRYYFKREPAETFSAALRNSSWYLDVSDYERWFGAISSNFGSERWLVVPFHLVLTNTSEVVGSIYNLLGLDPDEVQPSQHTLHQNDVVEYRNEVLRKVARGFRRSRVYPTVRRVVGADRIRNVRGRLTKKPPIPSTAEALASCDQAQRAELERFASRVRSAVEDKLRMQDAERGFDWSIAWHAGLGS
jgi:hypothetical protein